MSQVTVRDMLEAGAHFGHQTHRWNPKMKPYIYGQKSGIHILNLGKTAKLLQDAIDYMTQLGATGDKVLYVGTKRQAQDIIESEAKRSRQPYVIHRWLGGMLTNFKTIRTSVEKLEFVENQLAVGNVENLIKKEVNFLERKQAKLSHTLEGIRSLKKIPKAIFVVDTVREHLAISEAKKLGLKVIALVDSNSDPTDIDFPIPSNDDAIRALSLFATALTDAYLSGAAAHKEHVQSDYVPEASQDVDVVVRGQAEGA